MIGFQLMNQWSHTMDSAAVRCSFAEKWIWFGYKLWCLCGPDGYPYKLNIYTGKCETCTEPP